MFQLTAEEKEQVVANCDHLSRLKFSRVMPNAFTEHGAIMAASVVNTPPAVEMSVYVVRRIGVREQLILMFEILALLPSLLRASPYPLAAAPGALEPVHP